MGYQAAHERYARNYSIFCGVVVHRRTLADVGREHGLSVERVRQIVGREARQSRWWKLKLAQDIDIDTHSLDGMRQNAALLAGAVYRMRSKQGMKSAEDVVAFALRTNRGRREWREKYK